MAAVMAVLITMPAEQAAQVVAVEISNPAELEIHRQQPHHKEILEVLVPLVLMLAAEVVEALAQQGLLVLERILLVLVEMVVLV